jgi:hypothetical protein
MPKIDAPGLPPPLGGGASSWPAHLAGTSRQQRCAADVTAPRPIQSAALFRGCGRVATAQASPQPWLEVANTRPVVGTGLRGGAGPARLWHSPVLCEACENHQKCARSRHHQDRLAANPPRGRCRSATGQRQSTPLAVPDRARKCEQAAGNIGAALVGATTGCCCCGRAGAAASSAARRPVRRVRSISGVFRWNGTVQVANLESMPTRTRLSCCGWAEAKPRAGSETVAYTQMQRPFKLIQKPVDH